MSARPGPARLAYKGARPCSAATTRAKKGTGYKEAQCTCASQHHNRGGASSSTPLGVRWQGATVSAAPYKWTARPWGPVLWPHTACCRAQAPHLGQRQQHERHRHRYMAHMNTCCGPSQAACRGRCAGEGGRPCAAPLLLPLLCPTTASQGFSPAHTHNTARVACCMARVPYDACLGPQTAPHPPAVATLCHRGTHDVLVHTATQTGRTKPA